VDNGECFLSEVTLSRVYKIVWWIVPYNRCNNRESAVLISI